MALNAILHRTQPSWWRRLVEDPYTTLAKTLYTYRQNLIMQKGQTGTKLNITVVCVSDTHNSQPTLPPGEILIHAGDMTQSGTAEELQSQLDWLNGQPHTHKIAIAGNHDIVLDSKKTAEFGIPASAQESLHWGSVRYLERSSTTLRLLSGKSLKIYGHPSTRKHVNWAFQFDRGEDVFTGQIDDDVDILVTHSAPRNHLDVAGWGDEFLLRELWRVKPILHVFGHMHEGYGRDVLIYDRFERLYQRVCDGSSGILAVIEMTLLLLLLRIMGTDSEGLTKRTILVNACAVGGLMDEYSHRVQTVHL